MTKRDGNTSEVRKINCWTARNSRYNTKHEQASVGGKAIKWSMIIQSIEISDKMDFHNYVNKEITFVRSNGIMMYARGNILN